MRGMLLIPALQLSPIFLTACQDTQSITSSPVAAKPASKDLAAMERVTGLHAHFIKGTDFEFRLIEVDDSATVAMNPICLYLVVTNNSSGGQEQTRMVMLPQASKIKKVRFYESEPRMVIDVLLDDSSRDGRETTQIPASFEIRANITDGKLRDDIEVVVSKTVILTKE